MYFIRPGLLMRKIYSSAIWRIAPVPSEKRDRTIYLTFDDGPIPKVTPWVLSLLKEYKAKATFFCVGSNIEKHPELFRQIISEGHAVGNHTYHHMNGWKTKSKEYLENVSKCDSVINGDRSSVISYHLHRSPITGNCKPLFRPPYGKMKPSQFFWLRSHYSIIMWDVLSGDFDQTISKEKCLKNVITKTRAGSIVVFHDSIKAKENLYYVLPKFLEYFSEKEFVFDRLTPTLSKGEEV